MVRITRSEQLLSASIHNACIIFSVKSYSNSNICWQLRRALFSSLSYMHFCYGGSSLLIYRIFFPLPSNYLIHLSNPFALCIIFQFRKVYQYKASFAEGTFIVKKPQWHSQSPYCDQDILIQQWMSEKHKSWGKQVWSSTRNILIKVTPGFVFSV